MTDDLAQVLVTELIIEIQAELCQFDGNVAIRLFRMNSVEHFKDFLGGTACVVPGLDVFTQEVERCPHPETVRFVGCAQGVLQRFPGHKTKSGLSENPEAKNEVLEAFTTGQKEQERAHLSWR